MIYLLTDRNDKDRENPIIDQFDTREAAEAYAAELGYGVVEEQEQTEGICTFAVMVDADSHSVSRFLHIDRLPEPHRSRVWEGGCYHAYEVAAGIAVIVNGSDEPIVVKGI